ncbi:MAG: hypothetical protein NTW65_03885 [Deltaproteobacteria bacterium]|nr:hypothetical protein [Deltaproteobacteria bacterium]
MNRISALTKGEEIGNYFYGSEFNYGYGETSFLGVGTYSIYKYLGFGDHVAYYFFISTVFISSAFAVFLLANLYTGNFLASVFAGFAFTCSNFMFANIDDSFELWFFLAALSVYFLKKYIDSRSKLHLYLSFVLGGLQVYVNSYVFVFQTIMLSLVLICNIRKAHLLNRHFVFAAATFFSIIAPFFIWYIYVLHNFEIIDPWGSMNVISAFSLQPAHLIGVLSNNLLYKENVLFVNYFTWVRQHAFLGGVFFLLAGIGLFHKTIKKKELLLIALGGLILAIGPQTKIGSITIPCPMSIIYELNPVFEFFRVPLRAFFMTSLAFSILAAMGLSMILYFLVSKGAGRVGYAIAAVVFIIHFIENTPFPMESYNYEKYYQIPYAYSAFFKDKKNQVILDLPSYGITSFLGSERPVYGYNREVIYMIWQTHHKQNTLNGVYGYFTKKRLEIQEDIERLPEPDLFRKQRIDYIVYHKDKVLDDYYFNNELFYGDNYLLYAYIDKLPGMDRVYEDANLCIIKNSMP